MNATLDTPIANGQRFFGRTYTPAPKYADLPEVTSFLGALEKATGTKPVCPKEEMEQWYADLREIVDLHYSIHGEFRTEEIRAKMSRDPWNPNSTWGNPVCSRLKAWGYRILRVEKCRGARGKGHYTGVWGKILTCET